MKKLIGLLLLAIFMSCNISTETETKEISIIGIWEEVDASPKGYLTFKDYTTIYTYYLEGCELVMNGEYYMDDKVIMTRSEENYYWKAWATVQELTAHTLELKSANGTILNYRR